MAEVGRDGVDHRGLVRDAALYDSVRARASDCAQACGWRVQHWIDSPITGGDGNREFFIHARRKA